MRRCHHHRPTPAQRAQAEARARASIEAQYGHAITDAEWQEIKANLRQLFGLLASWQLPTHLMGRKHRE